MFNPLRTTVADAYATEFHSIRPGTDLAVALAMIKTILDEKIYSKEFLLKYSDAPALIDSKTGSHLKGENGLWLT